MNETYVYRKHLKDPKVLLVYCNIVVILLIFFISYGILITKNNGTIDYSAYFVVYVPIVGVYILIESLITYLLIRKFRRIQVTLTNQGIVYVKKKKQIVVPYEQIQIIEFPSIRYTGGWIKICYPGGNIRITVVLENIGGLLQNLKSQMKNRNMEYVYDEQKFFTFYKTAVFSDESWSRIYRIFNPLALTSLISSIITIVVLSQGYALVYGEKLMLASYVMPIIGYFVSEILIGQKIKKRVDSINYCLAVRDTEFEKKTFLVSLSIFTILYFLLLVIAL